MPQAPKRPCSKPGCPELTDSGYCVRHAPEANRQRERWRGSATSRGYDRSHQKLREQVFKEQQYLCADCLSNGRITPCTDLHHRLKIRTHPHLRLVRSNVVGLCKDCHEEAEKESI